MQGGETTGGASANAKAIICLTNDEIERAGELRARGEFFWLDIRSATDSEIAAVGDALGLHPLTIEDIQHFDQRAKIEDYDDYVYLVTYGSAPLDDLDRLAEVHIVYAPGFLLTAARDTSLGLNDLYTHMTDLRITGQQLLRAVLDVLVDSFVPLLDEIEDQVERIEESIFGSELREREVEIHDVRSRLGRVDRVVHRESAAYTRLPESLRRLPDHDERHAPYFRDVQDHLSRVAETAESLRDRIQSVFEIYLAALDTRQNAIMKQFTIIAGIFLPLTFLVGFFGQNFKWMTDNVEGRFTFLGFGIVLPLLIVAGMLVIINRRGMFKD